MSLLSVSAHVVTLLGLGLSFVGSLVFAYRGFSDYQSKLDQLEENTRERHLKKRERLREKGYLEPDDHGFGFISEVIQSQVGDIGSITRIEQPESEGLGNDIHVLTSDGERYEGVITTIQLRNAVDLQSEFEREQSDDAKIIQGGVYLAVGFLLQFVGYVIANFLI